MQRRTLLSLLPLAASTPLLATLLAACGDDGDSGTHGTGTTPGTTGNGDTDSLRSDVARATGGDPAAAAAAINAFAHDLYDALVAQDATANLVVSPASIAIALAMASAGAAGTTLQQMDDTLHITDPVTIHRSFNALAAALDALNQSRDNTAEGGSGTSEVRLSIANSLWGQRDLAFEQAFLDTLAGEYDAGLELVDYKSDPEAARVAINAWVADETEDRIPELLGEGSITPDARLTLVNAIYLKANWLDEFQEDATVDQPFTTAAGAEVQVRMMHRDADLAYAEGDGWQAIDLPYVFNGLSLTAAVGDDGAVLPTGDEVFAALAHRPVQLAFPRFDIETATPLGEVLRSMGMTVPFDAGQADFTGMTTAERLFISDVIHQANITTDEQGTEAAAATAVVMAGTGAPEPVVPVVVTFDRPFTFWLRDTATNAIVFIGRVTDPSQTR